MAYPLDPIHSRITEKKRNFTLSAGKTETIFFKDNEDGWVSEVLVYCNGDLTLEISLGTDIESMKISDAYSFGLVFPNASFWLPMYDTSTSKYVIAFQPFNPQPYQHSVGVNLINKTASDITVNNVIFKRIIMKPQVPGQEYPPYAVQTSRQK